MENLSEEVKDILSTSYEVMSQHWVDITHVINPHYFYVRLTKFRAFVQMMESTKPKDRPSKLQLDDTITFEMNKSGKVIYARGRILDVVEKGVEVTYAILALDYGYLEKGVSAENVYNCKEEHVNLAPLAKLCGLELCTPIGGETWSEEAIDTFKSFVNNERALMLICSKESNKLVVELRNSSPDDIATLMAYALCSTFGYVNNTVSRFTSIVPRKNYYTYKKLNLNETLQVRALSGKSLKDFYVAEVNDYENFMKEHNRLTYYANKQDPFSVDRLKSGEILLTWIRSDRGEKYERAVIKEVTAFEKKAKVQLLDWGKEEVVTISHMKPIPEPCLKSPVLALHCSVEENQEWDNRLENFLNTGYEFSITIKQLGDNYESPHIVNITHIQKQSISMLDTV